ncbi:MAG: hypothetical protein ACK4SY_07135 [Pyrobaculum sp.]
MDVEWARRTATFVLRDSYARRALAGILKSIREEPSLKTMREEVDDWWREIVEVLAAFTRIYTRGYYVEHISLDEGQLKLSGRFVAYPIEGYPLEGGDGWFELRLDLYAHRPEMSYMTVYIRHRDKRYVYRLNLATGEESEKVELTTQTAVNQTRQRKRVAV